MKRKTAIILAALLVAAIAVGIAYNTRSIEYAAVYTIKENITVYRIMKAPSRGAAWFIAERRTPPNSILHNVFQWTPPYPPPPSTWLEEATDP